MKIALQMYSVRDAVKDEETLFAALEKVRKMGYEGVEFAGCFGADPEKLRDRLKELGLTAVGCHEALRSMEAGDIDQLLAFYQKVGVKNFVCSFAPTSAPAEVEHLCGYMSMVKEKAEKLGMKTGYHNHYHEFKEMDGVKPIDKISACCPLELDTYWSFVAGEDTGAFIRQNRERIGLLHLKDGSRDGHPCAIGEGEADIRAVLEAARDMGAEWVIVENDNPVPDGFSDVARSMDTLKTKFADFL